MTRSKLTRAEKRARSLAKAAAKYAPMPTGIRFWRQVDIEGKCLWSPTTAEYAECISIGGPLEQLLDPAAHVVEPTP